MYKTKEITQEQLQAIKINNQNIIKQQTGSELNLVEAWEVIKTTSKNFTENDKKALEADELLHTIIVGKGKNRVSKENEKLQIQEKERARSIALLALELELMAA